MCPRPFFTVNRRVALTTALVGAAVVAGCDLTDSARPGGSPSRTPAEDPDQTLVTAVRAELDELVGLLTDLGQRHRRLRRPVAGLLAMHTAHRDALAVPDEPAQPSAAAPPGEPADLWTLVLKREGAAARRFEDWAVAAESGPLARLLGSMAAGVAAHVADAPAVLR